VFIRVGENQGADSLDRRRITRRLVGSDYKITEYVEGVEGKVERRYIYQLSRSKQRTRRKKRMGAAWRVIEDRTYGKGGPQGEKISGGEGKKKAARRRAISTVNTKRREINSTGDLAKEEKALPSRGTGPNKKNL